MKDENGIEICCENCRHCEYCDDKFFPDVAEGGECCNFETSNKALEARIADIDDINDTLTEVYEDKIKELEESFFATVELLGEIGQEADRLRAEVKELKAHNEVLQRRIEEFSMELLDRTMKENKDVLKRLKEAESEGEDEPFAENIASWIEENQNQDLSQFLANLDICCYSTKYNEDIICIQPNGENGWNFEIAQLFSNLNRTLAQYNRTKGFTRGFLERVELLFKLHKGQTNEQLKHILRTESEGK